MVTRLLLVLHLALGRIVALLGHRAWVRLPERVVVVSIRLRLTDCPRQIRWTKSATTCNRERSGTYRLGILRVGRGAAVAMGWALLVVLLGRHCQALFEEWTTGECRWTTSNAKGLAKKRGG